MQLCRAVPAGMAQRAEQEFQSGPDRSKFLDENYFLIVDCRWQ